MRLIDAAEAQKYADENMTEFSARIVRFALSVAKTVEAEPVRHGRWIKHKSYYGENYELVEPIECSNCAWVEEEITNYCPNCGARMDGESE